MALSNEERLQCNVPFETNTATHRVLDGHSAEAVSRTSEYPEACTDFEAYHQAAHATILNLQRHAKLKVGLEVQTAPTPPSPDDSDDDLNESVNNNDSNDCDSDDVSIIADDAEIALQLSLSNCLSHQIFRTLRATDLGSLPIFLYDKFVQPDVVASAISGQTYYCRTYEQALRMIPGVLLDHALIGHWRAGAAAGVDTMEGMEVEGMLLFSTTGRERVLLQEQHGGVLKVDGKYARIVVEGEVVVMRVGVFTYI